MRRATYLQYRSPKERTPGAYYPLRTNEGFNVNLFAQKTQSESLQGSFGKVQRFCKGSIYDYPFTATGQSVGPGAYKEEDVVRNMKNKPCMTTFVGPLLCPNEAQFELNGHVRILNPSYLPDRLRESFEHAHEKFKASLGRKVNETLVFTHTMSKSLSGRRGLHKTQTHTGNMSPEMTHVSRIRSSRNRRSRAQMCSLG